MSSRPPYHSRRVFVDTGGHFAVANRRDAHHVAARTILDQLLAERRPLFTTNFVLAETHALLLTRINREVAARVLFEIDRSDMTTIVRISAADEARARQIIREYQDKNFSLTDATSFAVMERLGITQAFAFDSNFSQYGFSLLSPDLTVLDGVAASEPGSAGGRPGLGVGTSLDAAYRRGYRAGTVGSFPPV